LISVVFSFMNESNNLKELVGRAATALRKVQQHEFEMIFVDDASTDNSVNILLDLQAHGFPEIVVVELSRNYGNSEALLAGFEVSKGDLVIYLDSDLQDPPELIPQLINVQLNSGVDVVHTVRISRAGESRLKLLVTKWGYKYLKNFYQFKIIEEAGDYKLLTRRVVDLLLNNKEHSPFTRGMIANLGFKQEVLEYDRASRGDGAKNTKYRLFSLRWIYSHLDRTLISFTDLPLKLTLGIGVLSGALSFLMICVVIWMKIAGLAVPGWAALMCSIFFLGGLQLLTLGVMGLYLNSIFIEVKNRPIYLIDKIHRGGGSDFSK